MVASTHVPTAVAPGGAAARSESSVLRHAKQVSRCWCKVCAVSTGRASSRSASNVDFDGQAAKAIMVPGQLDEFNNLFTGGFVGGQRPVADSCGCRRLVRQLPFCEQLDSPRQPLAAAMTRIIQGVLDFQKRIFRQKRELFHELGK